MELWSLYEYITMTLGTIGKKTPEDPVGYADVLLLSALVAVAVGLVFFVLQGFALYIMAKKRRLRYRWLAFVPFANIMLIGRLAGETTFFGQRIKRAGLYAMIAQIVITVLACSYIVSDVYLHQKGCIVYTGTTDVLEPYCAHFTEGRHFEKFLFNYTYRIAGLLNGIFSLLYLVLMITLLSGLFKKYAPNGQVWMTVLTVVVPLSRCIILFVLRNRRAVDYRAYMQAKREAEMRRYQQYYGQGGYRPYGGSPYNTPNQGYGPQGMPQNKPEDPFAEFSTDKKPEDPFEEFSSGKKGNNDGDLDGFFD